MVDYTLLQPAACSLHEQFFTAFLLHSLCTSTISAGTDEDSKTLSRSSHLPVIVGWLAHH